MRSFPGFEHLFKFFDPFMKSVMRANIDFDGDCWLLTRGVLRAEAPVRAIWGMGGARPTDVIWTTMGDPLLVHQRVIDVLLDNRFTGWATYPAVVFDKSGLEYTHYHGLVITGRCGRRNLSASKIELMEYPGGWYPQFVGHYFDEPSWDGSDLFMELGDETGLGNSTKFMTKPVVDALQRAAVKNLGFTSLAQVSINTSTYETAATSKYLPPDYHDRVHAAYEAAGVPRPRKWQR